MCLLEYHEVIRTGIYFVGLLGAAFGLCLAAKRVKAMERQVRTDADRLLQERFQRGAELMGHNHVHPRLAGIIVLRQMAEARDLHYKDRVKKVFLAYMSQPSHDRGTIEYTSRDTVEVVKSLMIWGVPWEGISLDTLKHIRETFSSNLAELKPLLNQDLVKLMDPLYNPEDYK